MILLREQPAPQISVIVETFNAGFDSDVSFKEALASLGAQEFAPDQVEYLMVTSSADEDTMTLLNECMGDFKASTLVLEAEDAGYHTAKIMGLEYARGKVVSFVES